MRLLPLLAAALLSTLLLAGCSDDGGGGDTTSTTTTTTAAGTTTTSRSSTTSTTSATTTTTSAPQNRAPVGSISASMNGTTATFALTGSDPDGDALSWTLVFGDATTAATGTTLPANVTHEYTLGNYTANFTVTDGKASADYQATLQVAAGVPANIVVASGDVSANCALACEACDPAGAVGCVPLPVFPGASGCLSFYASATPAPVPTVDCLVVPLPAAAAGAGFTLTSTGGDPDAEFFDVCDPVMGVSLGTSWQSGPEAGTVPAGAGCAILWEFNAVTPDSPSTLTFTVA